MTSAGAPADFKAAGYEAARSTAAFFRVEDGGRFRMHGPDAQDFMNRMVTNDIRSLAPGRGAYAALLDINGRMMADLTVWVIDPEQLLVETAADVQDTLMATLDRYIIMERIELEDARRDLARVTVLGPEAVSRAAEAMGAGSTALAPGEAWLSPEDPGSLILAARTNPALPGADLYVPAGEVESLCGALRAAGVEEGGPEAMEVLRIEAGIPKWGAELDTTVIPLEANLEGVGLSFTKGCYPGQEIIARIHSRGRPARHLAGIRFPDGAPAPGDEVLSGDQPVGRVTSAAVSPALGGLALAYLKKETAEPGAAVTAGGLAGVVSELPFAGPETGG